MIDGTYNVKVDIPLGRKDATVVLRSQGDVLSVDVDAPIIGKQHMEGQVEGNTFSAQGTTRIMLSGKINYTLTGEVSGDDLHISIQSNKGDFILDGVRV